MYSLVSTLDCPLPPPVTGGVCLATRVRYRQSCGLDIRSVLLAYLFVPRIAWRVFTFVFALVLFFPSPPIRSGGAFSSVIFPLFLFFYLFFGCSDDMERDARAREIGLMCGNNNGCRQEVTRLHAISCAKRRHCLDPFAGAKYNLLLKTHHPFERELVGKTAD